MECPWCYKEMEPVNDRCPHCKTAIFLPEEAVLEAEPGELEDEETEEERDLSDRVEDIIASRFRCTKCGGRSSSIQEVAMTGTGLSKLLDIQHHHIYLFPARIAGLWRFMTRIFYAVKNRGSLVPHWTFSWVDF